MTTTQLIEMGFLYRPGCEHKQCQIRLQQIRQEYTTQKDNEECRLVWTKESEIPVSEELFQNTDNAKLEYNMQ